MDKNNILAKQLKELPKDYEDFLDSNVKETDELQASFNKGEEYLKEQLIKLEPDFIESLDPKKFKLYNHYQSHLITLYAVFGGASATCIISLYNILAGNNYHSPVLISCALALAAIILLYFPFNYHFFTKNRTKVYKSFKSCHDAMLFHFNKYVVDDANKTISLAMPIPIWSSMPLMEHKKRKKILYIVIGLFILWLLFGEDDSDRNNKVQTKATMGKSTNE